MKLGYQTNTWGGVVGHPAGEGSGTLGDTGTHVIDFARYLVGGILEVMGVLSHYITERPVQSGSVDKLGTVKASADVRKEPVDTDDEVSTLLRFENGAVGSIEATRNAWGRNNFLTFEIHGETGSICFNYERRDELRVCFANDPDDIHGSLAPLW